MDERLEKRRPIKAAQWLAARAVSEGAPGTNVRVAAMLGCDVSAVYARAAAEGWRRLDFRTRLAREAHKVFIERVAGQNATDGVDGAPPAIGASAPPPPPPAVPLPRSTGEEPGVRPAAALDPPLRSGGGAERSEAEGARLGISDCTAGELDDPLALLARAARVLARRLADLVAHAEAGGQLNKAEIDGLLALARMTERWETLAKERAKEEETQSDEEIARTLRAVDRRILDLARAEAARLVEEGSRPAGGAAGSG